MSYLITLVEEPFVDETPLLVHNKEVVELQSSKHQPIAYRLEDEWSKEEAYAFASDVNALIIEETAISRALVGPRQHDDLLYDTTIKVLPRSILRTFLGLSAVEAEALLERHGSHNQKAHGNRGGLGATGGAGGASPTAGYKDLSKDELDSMSADFRSTPIWKENWHGATKYCEDMWDKPINKNLRGGGDISGYSRITEPLDILTVSGTLPDNTILHRNMGTTSDKAKLAMLKPGATFTDKGYGSTSAGHLKYDHASSVHATILAPKGTKAAIIGDHYGFNEREILLPRNTTYRVKSHSVAEGDIHQVVLEIIPTP
jgi:hypothetical protein